MRRPNGTGTIVKLSGNRRQPFVVRISARDKYGYVIQKNLSSHATSREAQTALDQYNAQRSSGAAPVPDKLSLTVQAVYDLWSTRKYPRSGAASVMSYKASWARLAPLSTLKMRDVALLHLQEIIDRDEAEGLSKSSIGNDKLLMRALFKYAMENDIVAKDYSEFVQLPSVNAKFEKGAFTDLQIKQLERLATEGFPWADTVLMLCYTGFRITEFLSLTRFSYHADGDYLMGGMKTDAGRNRVVPVHPKIKPYLMRRLASSGASIVCEEDGNPIRAFLKSQKCLKIKDMV